jgi:HPt (histidine-containing phosphotransfer) domain-containing protein
MFFILNNEKAVLAADKTFLDSIGAQSIYLLAEIFRSGEFPLDDANNTCQIKGMTRSFSKTPLQTTFGNGYLYQISEEVVAAEADIPLTTDATQKNDVVLPLEEERNEIPTAAFAVETPQAETEVNPWNLLDTEDVETTPAPSTEPVSSGDEDLLDLINVGEEEPLSAKSDPVPSEPETEDLEEDLLDLIDFGDEEPPIAKSDPVPPEPEIEILKETEDIEEEDLLDLIDFGESDETEKLNLPGADAPAPEDFLIGGPDPIADAKPVESISATSVQSQTHDDIFDLIDVDNPVQEKDITDVLKNTDPNAPLPLQEEVVASHKGTNDTGYRISDTPFADYSKNAEMIGITSEEYIGFLKQFTEESLGYEPGLKSQDLYVFKKNLTSIKDASQLLHLPKLSENLNGLEEATSQERETLLENFFGMIQHIQRDLDTEAQQTKLTDHTPEPTPPVQTAPETSQPEPAMIQPDQEEKIHSPESLDSIAPIPFEFSTKAASDELGLPETLVQEFVSDFVQQAEENLDVFQEALQTGNIDTIQKTAHLLKGAASNLRIDPLAATLKELQYNESVEKAPDLFRQFVGQLKTLISFTKRAGN